MNLAHEHFSLIILIDGRAKGKTRSPQQIGKVTVFNKRKGKS